MTGVIWDRTWLSTIKRLLNASYPILMGVLCGAALAGVLVLLLVPDNREISLEQYRWLSTQIQANPDARHLILKELDDDGVISNWELHQIKKTLREYAKQDLRQALQAK